MRTFLLGVLLLFGGRAVVSGAHENASGQDVHAQLQFLPTVPTQKALAAIREAQPSLNQQLNQDYSLSDYYEFYYDAELTVEDLGKVDGVEWYRVSYGGGNTIVAIEIDI